MSWGSDVTRQGGAWLSTANGHRIELMANRVYVFGRGEECDLRLDDSNCSRRHARISVSGDRRRLSLDDLGSKNGTFRNGHQVKGTVLLQSGDRIQIGTTEYTVTISQGTIEVQLDTRTTLLSDDD